MDAGILEFKDIEYIRAVYDYGTLTRAAEALFITQPTLSQYLQNLQKRLGLKLYRNEGRKIVLTYEGELLALEGKRMLKDREELLSAISDASHKGHGTLRIAVPLNRGVYFLPTVLPAFAGKYPDVSVRLYEGSSKMLVDLVENGSCDLFFANKPTFPFNLDYEILNKERCLLVVGKGTEAAKQVARDAQGTPHICLETCKNERFILHHAEQHTGQLERQILREAGIKPKVALETSNLVASYHLAAAGYGLTFLSEFHVKRLDQGDTLNCCIDSRNAYMDVIAGYKNRKNLTFLMREFLQTVRETVDRTADEK